MPAMRGRGAGMIAPGRQPVTKLQPQVGPGRIFFQRAAQRVFPRPRGGRPGHPAGASFDWGAWPRNRSASRSDTLGNPDRGAATGADDGGEQGIAGGFAGAFGQRLIAVGQFVIAESG